MKLVISTAWFPVCVGVYLLRAARRAGHEVRTVGPTSGDYIHWEQGVEFPGFGIAPDVGPGEDAPRRSAEAAEWCELWIDVDGGWLLEDVVSPKRRIGVATDPHCGAGWDGARLRSFCHKTFVMQSPYAQPGDGWLPYAYDPEWHVPGDDARAFDVTNLGRPYPERVEISERLAEKGLRVLGPGRTAIGPAYARLLRSAPIAVVWPMKDDLPCRVFEAAACGVFVLARSCPDYWRLFPPPMTVADKSPETMDEFIRGVFDLVDVLKLGGGSGAPPIGPEHSWDARLAQLVEGRDAP